MLTYSLLFFSVEELNPYNSLILIDMVQIYLWFKNFQTSLIFIFLFTTILGDKGK